MTWSAGKRERASHDMLGSTQFWLDEKSGGKFFKSRSRSVVMCAWVKLDGPRRVHAHKVQARIQGRWNGWIFIPLFLSSLLSFFSYPSNVEIIFDFSYFSDWGWKNSPSISKSWIRAWSKRTEHLRRSKTAPKTPPTDWIWIWMLNARFGRIRLLLDKSVSTLWYFHKHLFI